MQEDNGVNELTDVSATTEITMDALTPDERLALKTGNEVIYKASKTMFYLFERWQDEGQYEMWDDYVTPIKAFVDSANAMFISMRPEPFELVFGIGNFTFTATVTQQGDNLRMSAKMIWDVPNTDSR